MQGKPVIILTLMLLLVTPGIALSDAFAEKLIVSDGFDNTAQVSGIDKTTGDEIQLYSDSNNQALLGAFDFSSEGFLIAANSDPDQDENVGLAKLSLIIEDGYPNISLSDPVEFEEFYCTGLSFDPNNESIFYCLSDNILSKIDVELMTLDVIGTTGIDESIGNGLAIGSDGTIYLGNQIGLYSLSPNNGEATLLVAWNNDQDDEELIDEPNTEEPTEFSECFVSSMDFDSAGTLYGIMLCEEEISLLIEIGLDPLTVPTTLVHLEEPGDEAECMEYEEEEMLGWEWNVETEQCERSTEAANITLTFLQRNDELAEDLGIDPFDDGFVSTDPITFSPFDFDFLLGNTYGVVIDGFDSITATATGAGENLVSADGLAQVEICDNTTLSFDSSSAAPSCYDSLGLQITNVTTITGPVDAIFDPNDEIIPEFTSTLVDGDSVLFDSAECSLTNDNVENSITFTQTIEDPDNPGEFIQVDFVVEAQETLSCVKPIDHYLGYEAKVVRTHHDHDDDDDDGNGYNYKYQNWSGLKDLIKDKDWDKVKDLIEDKDWKGLKKIVKESDWKKKDNQKLEISLEDELAGKVNYEVKKIKKLFNPVDAVVEGVESDGIASPESHLVEYQIKKLKGEPKFEKIKNIVVTNEFGETTVAVKKDAKKLLVPSAKDPNGMPDELDNVQINHFKCYDTKYYKFEPKWEKKRTVTLTDQFGSMTMELKKPRQLCLPAEKIHDDVTSEIPSEENYLLCYDLKKIKGEPKFKKQNVFVNNQFGPDELEVKKPKKLCVPSEVVLP